MAKTGNPDLGNAVQDGTYEKLEKLMRRTPTKLFTRLDIMKPLDKGEKACDSALNYLWRSGRIYRHKEKAENRRFQFAISIAENHREEYEPSTTPRLGGASDLQAINRLCEQIITNTVQLQQLVTETVDKMKNDLEGTKELMKVVDKLKKL